MGTWFNLRLKFGFLLWVDKNIYRHWHDFFSDFCFGFFFDFFFFFHCPGRLPAPWYVNTTLYRNSRISRLNCGKTIKDRGLSFGMVLTHMLKAKTAKFQVLSPFGSLFFRYPIFKVYTIVYNSAGRFSTPLKTFSSRRVFRPFIEQGASTPVLWSRGASPPSSRGCLFPRSRLPAL